MKIPDKEIEATPPSSDFNPSKLPFIWSWELLENRLPASKMVLSPWLPERGVALIYGQRGCGKTRLAVAIAYAIATGDSLMGWQAPRGRTVLYLDGSMSSQRLAECLLSMAKGGKSYQDQIPIAFLTPDEFIERKQQVLNAALQDTFSQRGQEALLYQFMEKTNLININNSGDQARLLSDVNLFDVIVIDNVSPIKNAEFIKQKGVQDWAMTMRALGKSVLFVDAAENYETPIEGKYAAFLDTVIALQSSSEPIIESKVDVALQYPCFNVHFEKTYCVGRQATHPFRAELIVRSDGSHHWVASDITH